MKAGWKEGMMRMDIDTPKVWFTSDTHFNHANIIKYCGRPFAKIEDMDYKIIDNWNKVVAEEDMVIFVGDFGFFKHTKSAEEYTCQLNGSLVPLKGNHDKKWGINAIIESMVIKHKGTDWYISHYPEFKFKHNICGHVHEKWKVRKQGDRVSVNVGVDVWDFTPISMDDIVNASKKA